MNTAPIIAAAKARGLGGSSGSDEVALAVSPRTEIVLIPTDDPNDEVYIVLVWPTWTHEHGPDADEQEYGVLPLAEALSFAVWYGKADDAALARAEAEIDRGTAAWQR